jgi:type I restriction enzyme R subunit
MSRITETDIELLAIEELEELGWDYVYGPDIAFDGLHPERENYQEVILKSRLKSAIQRINKNLPEEALDEAFNKVLRVPSPDLIQSNETFHDYLKNGINVEYQVQGDIRGDLVNLIDNENIDNNDFLIVNQYTVIENQNNKRPDLVLFINGIP